MSAGSSSGPSSGLLVVKIFGAVVIIAASLLWFVPRMQDMVATDDVVDSGPRGLVVVATQGGDRLLTLHVDQRVEKSGEIKLVIYVSAENTEYGDKGNVREVQYSLSFIGSSFSDGVECGGQPVGSVGYTELPEGTRHVVEVDAASSQNSALNTIAGLGVADSTESPSVLEQLQSSEALNYRGSLWTLKDDDSRSSRSASGDNQQYVWAEECTLPMQTAWRLTPGHDFADSPQSTLLPFQVNWTGLTGRTDFHQKLDSDVVVARGSGKTLAESYPTVSTGDERWFYTNTQNWVKSRGEDGNFAYTDQPVLMFTDRASSEKFSMFLLWSGVLLGLIGTLLVEILSWGADLWAIRRAA